MKKLIFILALFGFLDLEAQFNTIQFNDITSQVETPGFISGYPFQDSKGYIWSGGRSGLYRFDGTNMKMFPHEPNDSLTISDNKISDMYEDENGFIWITTHFGLNKYDPKTETFKRFYTGGKDSNNGCSNLMGEILNLVNDKLFLNIGYGAGMNGLTVCIFDIKTEKFDHDYHNPKSSKYLDIKQRYRTDGQAAIWYSANDTLTRFDLKELVTDRFLHNPKDSTTINSNEVKYVFYVNKDETIIGTDIGYNVYDIATKTITRNYGHPKDHLPFLNERIHNTFFFGKGTRYLISGAGLHIVDHVNHDYTLLTSERDKPTSLPNHRLMSILEDHAGVVWIKTFNEIHQLNPHRKKFYYFDTTKEEPHSFVRHFIEVGEKKLLIKKDGELVTYDLDTDESIPFTPLPKDKEHLDRWGYGPIRMLIDSHGNHWFGFNGGGLFMLDEKTKEYQHYYFHSPTSDVFQAKYNMVYDIIEDSKGRIWVAGYRSGVMQIDPKTQTVKRYVHDPSDPTSLVGNEGVIIYEDQQNQIWISTRQGLNKYNETTDGFTHYTNDPYDPLSISENTALSMFEDEKGNFWIGTNGGGLNKMDRDKGTFISYTLKDGLADNNVLSINTSKKGLLWLSTFAGITSFDPSTETFKNYAKGDGSIQSTGANGFTPHLGKFSGIIYAEYNEGIIAFHPDSIDINPVPPKIQLEKLIIDNKEVPIAKTEEQRLSKQQFFLSSHISDLSSLSLNHNQKTVTFELAAFHYDNPANNEFAYQLEGFNKDWQYIGNKREVTFTNLNSGRYTFLFKAANPDGVWSEVESLDIIVHPPWWRTWWAYALYAFAILGSLYLYIRGLRQTVRQKQAQLEKEQNFSTKLKSINEANQKFVPQGFLEILGKKSIEDLRLGDQTEEQMTILFSDIRSYTSLSETMTPKENFNFINTYLGRVGPVIKKHGGFISQYYGDGLMALFLNDHEAAVKAAIEVQDELRKYNVERVTMGRKALRTGIGLNTGKLMLGIIGDAGRYDSTVISDAVNTASRMEGLTKTFGGSVIISEKTMKELPDDHEMRYRYLGMIKVKGKDAALKIYDFYEGDGDLQKELKDKTKLKFEDGINYYFNRKFGKAADCFKEVLSQNEEDKASSYYLAKAVKYIVDGVEDHWNGVEEMVVK